MLGKWEFAGQGGASRFMNCFNHRFGWVGEATFLELSREVWIPMVQMPQAKNKSALCWEKTVQD